jgi:potassium/sodium efflux P-type ATPase
MGWRETQAWHAQSASAVVGILESDEKKGLASADAAERLIEAGPNKITGQRGPGPIKRFLLQFCNPLVYVLLVAGGITVLLPGHLVDASVIFGVVIVNAVVGFIQESRAHAAIEALSKLVSHDTTVVRDGQPQRMDATQLVPGDVVLLQSGDRVPADLRLLRLRDLQIDESMLTGESLSVAKEHKTLVDETPLADRKNLAYSGTLVTYGQGAGIVVATGNQTELGRISHLLESVTEIATPLTRRLGRFGILLSWVIISLAAITFFLGLWRGGHTLPAYVSGLISRDPEIIAIFGSTFIAAVALAVAAIPEGLPAAVTIILAIGVSRMAKRNAIIRKLPAVETLGSTAIICSDKTGTLTKNEMTVAAILTVEEHYRLSGVGYQPEGSLFREATPVTVEDALAQHGVTEGDGAYLLPATGPRNERGDAMPVTVQDSTALHECLRCGALCNDSRLVYADDQWQVEGDPTEGALLTSATKGGLELARERAENTALDTIPFESERQYMATLHRHPKGGTVIYLKGAVEKVLALCGTMLTAEGTSSPIDRETLYARANELAAEGLRVLAFASKPTPAEQETLEQDDLQDGMTFLGFQGMIDPPRPEAIAAVQASLNAGITVKMITGDHALTARTIARQIGIIDDDGAVVTGSELTNISDEALPVVVANTHIFARVAPEQKLRLVRALQALDHVVAMTGDGVNDAPSLRQADIGVAMGITGTEVSKDAADMILTDDNFASIEAAVEEGRGVYENLRKFITWTLPTNAGEGMLILAAIILALPAIPIQPVQILWINLTTAIALGMMLAFEPKEKGLMKQPPRDPKEPLLTTVLLWRTAYVSMLMVIGAYALFMWKLGTNAAEELVAQTIAASVVVMVELVYLFNTRSLTHPVTAIGFMSNPWALFGAGLMILLQMAFVYLPFMNNLFNTRPISALAWLEIAAIAIAIHLIVEFEKWLRRTRERRKTTRQPVAV